MQIRKGPKPLGMTGLANGLDSANWPWTHLDRARRPPMGGEPRRRPMRKHLKFLCPNSNPLKFFHQKLAPTHPHWTTSPIIQVRWI